MDADNHPLEEAIGKENDDPMEGFDALLMVADCYSDEEWQKLFRNDSETPYQLIKDTHNLIIA